MIIEIEDLRFDTIIGILDFERVKKQQVIVNLKAKYQYKKGDFINYVDLTEIIKDSMNIQKFELLEDAIEHISNKIKTKYPQIESLYLKITKPDILDDCRVSLVLDEKEQNPYFIGIEVNQPHKPHQKPKTRN